MPDIRGTFEVKRHAEPPYDDADGVALGRSRFEKRYHGALDATAAMQMLSAMTPVQGSAGYVGIERVTGTLDGRAGTFVLQHGGTMTRGTPSLSVTVVPDSGTGELRGLAGQMTIEIVAGEHFYVFTYTLEG